MHNKPVVTIIGGGIIGLFIAYFFKKSNIEVLVIEKGSIGHGASYGNAGLMSYTSFQPLANPNVVKKSFLSMFHRKGAFYIPFPPHWELMHWLWIFRKFCKDKNHLYRAEALYELNRFSLDSLLSINDFPLPLWHQGKICLVEKETSWIKVQEEIAQIQNLGFSLKTFDKEQFKELGLPSDTQASKGFFCPGDKHVHSYRLVNNIRSFLQSQNVPILEHTTASEDITFNNKKIIIKTPSEHYETEKLILAAGAYTPNFLKKLGYAFPLQAAKGYSFTQSNTGTFFEKPVYLYESKIALTPLEDDLRFAGTLEFSKLDHKIRLHRVKAILKEIQKTFPKFPIKPLSEGKVWFGYRHCSADGLPIIDSLPRHPQIFTVVGNSMMGMLQSAACGKIITHKILNIQSPIDTHPFRANRFQ